MLPWSAKPSTMQKTTNNKNDEKTSVNMETSSPNASPSSPPLSTAPMDVLKPFDKQHRNQSYRNKTSAEIIKETKNLLAGGKKYLFILVIFVVPKKNNMNSIKF